MATFHIESNGGTYEIDAPDENAALSAFQGMGAAPAPAPATAPSPAPQAAAPTSSEQPEYDAMGNATGGTVTVQAPKPMAYSDQMGNAFGAIGHGANVGMRQAADGMTFGLADKAAAGMQALTGQAPSYDAALKDQRTQTEGFATANPITTGALRLGGGLAGGYGLLKNGVSLAGSLAENAPLWLKAGTMGVEGAGYGAADRAGHVDNGNLSDYGNAALEGAKGGFAIGAGMPVAGRAIGKAYEMASPFVQSQVPGVSRMTGGILGNAASADAGGLGGLAKLGDQAMLADAGPSFLGTAQGVVTKPGEGKSALVGALEDRFNGRSGRLLSDVDANLGPAEAPTGVKQSIEDTRSAIAESLFKKAYGDVPPAGPAMNEIAGRPAVSQALQKSGEIAANQGTPLPQITIDQAGNVLPSNVANTFATGSRGRLDQALGDFMGHGKALQTADEVIARRAAQAGPLYDAARNSEIPPDAMPVDLLSRLKKAGALGQAQQKMGIDGQPFDIGYVPAWDYMKRALDDRISVASRKGANDDVRIFTGLKKEITNAVDDAVPAYAKARQTFAGHSELLGALKEGRKVFQPGTTREEVERAVKDLTPGEQEMYRLGASNAMREKLANAGDTGNLPHTVFGNQAIRDKMQTIAPSRDAFDRFGSAVSNEQKEFTNAAAPNVQAWRNAYDTLGDRAKSVGMDTAEGRSIADAQTDLRAQLEQNPTLKQALQKQDYYGKVDEAVDLGANVLKKGDNAVWPEQLQGAYQSMTPGERAALYKGARGYIGNQLGTNANDLAALKRTMGGEGDWNRSHMDTIFGQDPTNNVLGAVNREQRFSDTYADVARNSQSAQRLGGAAMLDAPSEPKSFIPKDATIPGLIGNAIERGVKGGYRSFVGARSDNARNELGQALSATGPTRDAIVEALLNSATRRGATRQSIEGAVANPALSDAIAAAYERRTGRSARQ